MADAVLNPVPALPTGRTRVPQGALGLGLLIAATAVVAAGAADNPSLLVHVPPGRFAGWLAGPLRELEAAAPSAPEFAGLLVAMVAGYLIAVRRASALGARTVLGAIVLLHLIALLAPPLLTTDVFSYVAYGRLGALHGIDPYVAAPIRVPHDAIYPWVGWRHARSAYGPLFTLLTYPLAAIGIAPAVWTLKLVAALSSLGCVALVWRTALVRRIDPVRAVALVGLNPVLLIWVVAGAHNDLLMMLAMSAAVALAVTGREAAGAAAAVVGAAVKVSSVLILPFLVLGSARRGRAVTGAVVAAAAVGLGAVLVFGGHAAGFLDVLGAQQHTASGMSVPTTIAHLAGRPVAAPGLLTAVHVAGAAALLALVVATARGLDWIEGAALALVVAAAASGWLMPWYTVWALPLAVLVRRPRALIAVFALQGLVLAHVLAATA